MVGIPYFFELKFAHRIVLTGILLNQTPLHQHVERLSNGATTDLELGAKTFLGQPMSRGILEFENPKA